MIIKASRFKIICTVVFFLNFDMNSSPKNYTCEICEKKFSTNHYKKQHIKRIHEDVKKFICNLCSKNFVEKKELSIHIENNHKKSNHTCDSCGKSLSQSALRKHINTVHSITRNWSEFVSGHPGHLGHLAVTDQNGPQIVDT